MRWWRALIRFIGESLEALADDDRDQIRRDSIQHELDRRRWHHYLYSRPP